MTGQAAPRAHDAGGGLGSGPERRAASHEKVFGRAGVGTWSIDLPAGTLRTNQATRMIMEWPDGQPPPTRQDLRDAIHPDDRAEVARHMARLLAAGEDYTLEHRLLLPSGQVRHMHAVVAAHCDATGTVVAVHGVTLDVTDLWQARAQAEQQRQLSRTILASITEGYVLTRNGVIVEVNDALCRITGMSATELVGTRAPYPYWPPGAADQLRALHDSSRGSSATEFDAVHRNGRRLRLSHATTTLPDADGAELCLVLIRDVTKDRELEQSLRSRAATDPLTGVPNSRAFRTALRDAVAVSAQTGEPLSLALIDVDHFKSVNDRFGHAVGDEVLVAVVTRLTEATAGAGLLARVGGEEFALLLPGHDGGAARLLLAAALQTLRGRPVPTAGTVTASAGVAELQAGMTDAELYRRADELLYQAKAQGRDQVC